MQLSDMSKVKRGLMLAAIFLSTMCTMGDMIIVPVMSNFYELFDDVAAVNFLISGPALVGLFFCIIGGRLADIINKKVQLIIGFAIFAVTGIFGAAFVNLPYMTICRLFCTGVAWGLTSTAALGILAELYVDEARHGTVVGWYNGVMAALGAAMSFMGGILALNGWQVAYNAYWFSIVVLVMIIFFVPSMPARKRADAKQEKAKGEAGWWKKSVPFYIQFLLVAMSYYVIAYLISLYVADAGIGNEALSGTLSSVGTITSCIACMTFGIVYAKLKRAIALPSFFILGLCFLLLAAVQTVPVSVAVCAIMGAAWGIFYSYYFTRCTEIVPAGMQGTALGVAGAINGIAAALYTYVLTGIEGAMGTTSCVPAMGVLGIICLAVAIVSTVVFLKNRKKISEETAQA